MTLDQKIIDFLRANSGKSIQYRLRREILGEPPHSAGMVAMQESILSTPRVKKILKGRQEDGWIGTTLHGVPPFGLDSNVRVCLAPDGAAINQTLTEVFSNAR